MAKIEIPNEEYKFINDPCFTSKYAFTKSGRLFKISNVDTNRISEIKPHCFGKGSSRTFFLLKIKGNDLRGNVFYLDEMLAKYFLPVPKEGQILIHIDNDYQNSKIENLKWGYPHEHVFLDCDWEWINGFEGKYLIDVFGRLYSINGKQKGFQLVSGSRDSVGYHIFSLRCSGAKKKDVRRHTLLAKAFIPNPENKPFINHKNGVKGDDRIENLEWVTALENSRHAIETGLLDTKGEKHVRAKLTEGQVLEIRKLAASGILHSKIAENYPITRRQVTDIVRGRNWGWLMPSVS